MVFYSCMTLSFMECYSIKDILLLSWTCCFYYYEYIFHFRLQFSYVCVCVCAFKQPEARLKRNNEKSNAKYLIDFRTCWWSVALYHFFIFLLTSYIKLQKQNPCITLNSYLKNTIKIDPKDVVKKILIKHHFFLTFKKNSVDISYLKKYV